MQADQTTPATPPLLIRTLALIPEAGTYVCKSVSSTGSIEHALSKLPYPGLLFDLKVTSLCKWYLLTTTTPSKDNGVPTA